MGIEHWLQLALTNGLGPILIRRLLDACGSAEAACNASASLLCGIEGIGTATANQIVHGLRAAAEETPIQLDLADKAGVELISMQDPRYPALLLTIHDPPPLLFVRGTLEDRDLNAIAIVGLAGRYPFCQLGDLTQVFFILNRLGAARGDELVELRGHGVVVGGVV